MIARFFVLRWTLPMNTIKTLPHNFDAENSVIGSALLDNTYINALSKRVHPSYFYSIANGKIWNAICELHGLNVPVDLITLSDHLDKNNILGENFNSFGYIAEIANNTPSARNSLAYAEILVETYVHRKSIMLRNDQDVTPSMLIEKLQELGELNKKSRFDLSEILLTQNELVLDNYSPKEVIFDNCLPCGEVGILTGAGGTGKSFATIHIAMALALSIPAFNGYGKPFKPTKRGKVLIIAAEDSKEDYGRRMWGVRKEMSIGGHKDLCAIQNNLLIQSVRGLDNRMIQQTKEGTKLTGVISDIIDLIHASNSASYDDPNGEIRLVIIDPLARFYGGKENDNDDATFFINAVNRICVETGAGVLLIHHSAKGNKGGSRGASGFVDACRTHISLRSLAQDKENKKQHASGINPTDRNKILISLEKSNHVKLWDHDIYLQRKDTGAFEAIEPDGYLESLAKKEKEADQMDMLLEYIDEQGEVSGRVIKENKCYVFGCDEALAPSKHVIDDWLKRLSNDGLIEKIGTGPSMRWRRISFAD